MMDDETLALDKVEGLEHMARRLEIDGQLLEAIGQFLKSAKYEDKRTLAALLYDWGTPLYSPPGGGRDLRWTMDRILEEQGWTPYTAIEPPESANQLSEPLPANVVEFRSTTLVENDELQTVSKKGRETK